MERNREIGMVIDRWKIQDVASYVLLITPVTTASFVFG